MDFLIDTANLEQIKKYNDTIPLTGVTSNPSLIKKEGKIDFFEHMNSIRESIGLNKSLHVQVVAQDYEGILKDAQTIVDNVDKDVFIKIPVDAEGIKAIKKLKDENYNVTATAIYTKFQAYLAIATGADYITTYFNRMENLDINPSELIREVSRVIYRTESKCKIMGASFKNISQVNSAIENGAHVSTISGEIIDKALGMPSIKKASNDFKSDLEELYGKDSTISNL